MGTVTKSIGTSARDYSTLQAWEDALPANLVTDGNSQVGQCYNDSEFTAAGVQLLLISGETTDSTHTITLNCATGQSFKDNASVQSNALNYNQANGVGCSVTAAGTGITSSVAFTTVDGIQLKLNGSSNGFLIDGADSVLQNCILVNENTGNSRGVRLGGIRTLMRNCLVISQSTQFGGGCGVQINNEGLLVFANCTIVRPSDGSNFGLGFAFTTNSGGHYGGVNKIINCAAFGFATFTDDTTNFGAGSTNNCTDLASTGIGSANQVSKTYSSQFQGVTIAAGDYRAKTAADLLNNGATDTTDVPAAVDIAKTSRPQGASWDIGAWELVVASFLAAWANQSNLRVLGTGTY